MCEKGRRYRLFAKAGRANGAYDGQVVRPISRIEWRRVQPYYDQDGMTIYHGDCRELLGSLARGSVLVTDPPYGVNFRGKTNKHTRVPGGGYSTRDAANIGPYIVALLLPHIVRGLVFTGIRRMFMYPRPADVGCVFNPAGAGNGPWGWT